MTEEQEAFLASRFLTAVRLQPRLRSLRKLLLTLGGTHFVAPPSYDHSVDRLIADGFIMAAPIHLKRIQLSRCHANVSKLWTRKRRTIVGIGTGYALSKDGLWRQHSWGLLREGILETTGAREKYFGILLQSLDADSFSEANTPHPRSLSDTMSSCSSAPWPCSPYSL
jgi:hypothetical protein